MSRFARTLPALEPVEVLNIDRPESLFSLRERRFGSFQAPLARVFSQARQLGAGTVVVEKLPEMGELAEETADLTLRRGKPDETLIWRLCFFHGHPTFQAADDASACQFLGYAILREDWWKDQLKVPRIYESVMAHQDRGHNYVRGELAWEVRCGPRIFQVKGHLFAQQNDLTNVCAHAALRTVCARHAEHGDLSYRQINNCLGINHTDSKRKVGADDTSGGSTGLNLAQIESVLQHTGISRISHYYGPGVLAGALGASLSNAAPPPYSYQRSLYGSLESGYPALLVFGTVTTVPAVDVLVDGKRATVPAAEVPEGEKAVTFPPTNLLVDKTRTFFHVVPVIGHTFNQDMWVPRAETTWGFHFATDTGYLPSDLWLSAFVAHDDGLGSNYCIPKHYLETLRLDKAKYHEEQRSSGVMAVIETLPKGILRDPINAELQAHVSLTLVYEKLLKARYSMVPSGARRWIHHIRHELDENRVVLRPLLLNIGTYIDHLHKLRGWTDTAERHELIDDEYVNALKAHDRAAENQFWMIEFSVMELFPANLRKLGEVLVTAGDEQLVVDDARCLLAVRLPGLAAIHTGVDWDESSWHLLSSKVITHTSVFGAEHKDPADTQAASGSHRM